MFAARAVDPQLQAKGGMHSGLTIFHFAMIVPNSLLKVLKKASFVHIWCFRGELATPGNEVKSLTCYVTV